MTRLLLALALLSAFLVACTRSRNDAHVIRVHLPSEPVSLDPALAEDDWAVKVLCNTAQGLMGYDNEGKLHERLAAKVELSPDRKRYTFTLRPGARWSDGKPVTAEQFVLGLRRSLDPKTGSKIANMLFSIRGARAFYTGKAPADAVGVHAEGEKLVIELERPTSYFLHALTLAQASPARADVLEAGGGKWPAEAPSTGPYRIEKHLHEQEIRLVPNPHYWDSALKRLPVTFKIIPDESQAVSLFEAGKLDVVGRVPPLDLERMRKAGFVREFYQVATYFLAFNSRKPPFDDRDFRRAVAGSIDREELVKLLGTASRAAGSWIPPNLEGFVPFADPAPLFADSVKKVKARLAGGKPIAVTAALTQGNQQSILMEKIQSDLRTKLGLHIELVSMDWKAYVNLLKTATPQIYRYQRGAPFMDPIWHLMSFEGNDPNNYTGWKNAEYDRLVEEIAALASGPAREAKVLRAEKILTERDAAIIPLIHVWQTHLVSPRLTGYRANPVNEVHYEEVGKTEPL